MKKSSYQKLKEENLKLKQELIKLSTEPDSLDGVTIRMKWRLLKKMEQSIWSGDTTHLPASKFAGFIKSNDNILA